MNKIIIIEDTRFLTLRLEKLIGKHKLCDVQVINPKSININEAYLKSIYKSVALFIIDLNNYSNNGVNLISVINGIDKAHPVPIIALSSNSKIATLKQAVVAGCTDFLLKPFEDSTFIQKVQQILSTPQINGNSHTKLQADMEFEMKWTKGFEIQIDEIDNEHREIIQKYEMLYKFMKEGKGHEYYKELLSFLNDYVHTHFENEQILHEASNYDLKVEHRQLHEEFKTSVLDLVSSHNDKIATNLELIMISLFIKKWLVHHILVDDRKFGDFIIANKKR